MCPGGAGSRMLVIVPLGPVVCEVGSLWTYLPHMSSGSIRLISDKSGD